MKEQIKLSTLGHTWLLDIDGTIVKHNGYKIDGKDSFLPGAVDFLKSIPPKDKIIFLTARSEEHKEITEEFFANNGIRFDSIIYGLPYGERILINDKKPSGLELSYGINTERDSFMDVCFIEDECL